MPAVEVDGAPLAIVPGRAAARLWPVLDRARQEALHRGQMIAPEVVEAIDSIGRAGEQFLRGEGRRALDVGVSPPGTSSDLQPAAVTRSIVVRETMCDGPAEVGTADAARSLGVCPRTIRNYWKAGRLPGRLVGRQLLVERAAVEELRRHLQ